MNCGRITNTPRECEPQEYGAIMRLSTVMVKLGTYAMAACGASVHLLCPWRLWWGMKVLSRQVPIYWPTKRNEQLVGLCAGCQDWTQAHACRFSHELWLLQHNEIWSGHSREHGLQVEWVCTCERYTIFFELWENMTEEHWCQGKIININLTLTTKTGVLTVLQATAS